MSQKSESKKTSFSKAIEWIRSTVLYKTIFSIASAVRNIFSDPIEGVYGVLLQGERNIVFQPGVTSAASE